MAKPEMSYRTLQIDEYKVAWMGLIIISLLSYSQKSIRSVDKGGVWSHSGNKGTTCTIISKYSYCS